MPRRDSPGNRTAQTVTITSTQVTNYVYDAANRLTSVNGQAYTWDNNGNLINDGSAAYLYDRANRMISTTVGGVTTQFSYNGDGARLKQIIAGVPTTYTQDLAAPLPVVLQSQTGANAMQYVYALGTRPLAAARNGEAWEYLLPDAPGSVRCGLCPSHWANSCRASTRWQVALASSSAFGFKLYSTPRNGPSSFRLIILNKTSLKKKWET